MKINKQIKIEKLTEKRFNEAVNLVLVANLDTREEIEHHLKHLDAHYIALDNDKIVGVIGWYQDNVHYANEAMGDKFPGEEAYWVGFFTTDKNYRRQGIGFALLQKLEQVIKEKGEDKIWVSSVPETKDYYQRQGFELVLMGYINGNQKCFMVKKLQ
ncbi:MAG: GNAT family N-acetyltransferase [Candidatus Gottesmanbacteria bacterium]